MRVLTRVASAFKDPGVKKHHVAMSALDAVRLFNFLFTYVRAIRLTECRVWCIGAQRGTPPVRVTRQRTHRHPLPRRREARAEAATAAGGCILIHIVYGD